MSGYESWGAARPKGGMSQSLWISGLLAALLAAAPAAAQHEHHPPAPEAPAPATGHEHHHAAPQAPEAPAPPASGHEHHHAGPAMPSALPQPAPVRPATITLAELEARALRANPALRQAEEALAASDGARLGGAPLPNPTIGYTAEDVPVRDGEGSGRHGVFFAQEVPLGGKLRLERDVEARELDGARQRALGAKGRLLAEIRLLYTRGLAAQHRLEVRERLAAVALEAVEVTHQLFNTGAADQPDRLAIENEAALAAADLSAARSELAQLREALRRSVGDPDLTPELLAHLGGEFDAGPPLLQREPWRQRLLAESPEIAAAQAAEARAAAALARARAESSPDLSLEAGVRERRGGDLAGEREAFADVGVRVPLWNRNRNAIAAAEAEAASRRLALETVRLDLERRFAAAFGRYEQGQERVLAYRSGVLDRARQAHELYLNQYSQMMAAYPQVLVASRTRIQMEEDYGRALERAWLATVEIQSLLVASGEVETMDGGSMAGH
jgi:cobalt-zinc-cadmium efflux system outer membrane protein